MGLFDKAKGKAKDFEGKATDDKSREAEGHLDQAKGEVKDAIDDVKDAAGDAVDHAKDESSSAGGRAAAEDRAVRQPGPSILRTRPARRSARGPRPRAVSACPTWNRSR